MIPVWFLLLAAVLTGLSLLFRQAVLARLPKRRVTSRIQSLLEAAPFICLSVLILLAFIQLTQFQTSNPVWLAVCIFYILLVILSRNLLLSSSLSAVILLLVHLQL